MWVCAHRESRLAATWLLGLFAGWLCVFLCVCVCVDRASRLNYSDSEALHWHCVCVCVLVVQGVESCNGVVPTFTCRDAQLLLSQETCVTTGTHS